MVKGRHDAFNYLGCESSTKFIPHRGGTKRSPHDLEIFFYESMKKQEHHCKYLWQSSNTCVHELSFAHGNYPVCLLSGFFQKPIATSKTDQHKTCTNDHL